MFIDGVARGMHRIGLVCLADGNHPVQEGDLHGYSGLPQWHRMGGRAHDRGFIDGLIGFTPAAGLSSLAIGIGFWHLVKAPEHLKGEDDPPFQSKINNGQARPICLQSLR